MTPETRRSTPRLRLGVVCTTVLAVCGFGSIPVSRAAAPAASAPREAAKARAEQGLRWHELKPAQQTALKPLELEWSGIDAERKQKWLQISARFPKMTPAEQLRVQERMSEWAKLTPQQRGQARMNYQEARQLPAQDRQARWNEYQALSPEQRQQLATRAEPIADVTPKPPAARSAQRDAPQAKSNMVPNPVFAAPPRPIEPTVMQARPGVTTTPITKRPSPPTHQQPGLPKIAATPEFVNKATLLPQRGPQGAAIRSPVASTPASAPERPAQK